MRKDEPGWELIADPDGRRGLWMRQTVTHLELCAGRDGDDTYVKIELGQEVTTRTLASLAEVMETLRYAVELERDTVWHEAGRISGRIRAVASYIFHLRRRASEAPSYGEMLTQIANELAEIIGMPPETPPHGDDGGAPWHGSP